MALANVQEVVQVKERQLNPEPVKRHTKTPVMEPDKLLAMHLRNTLRGLVWDESHRRALDIVQLALVDRDDKVWTLVRKQLLDIFNAHERLQSAVISQLFSPLDEEMVNE